MQKLAQIPIWQQERMLDVTGFGFGLHVLEDTTAAPLGSARLMTNMMITDKGGISNRGGTSLFGAVNSDTNGTHGFYNYVKSFGSQELFLRSYSTELEYYHPTLNLWTRLMNGYTSNQEFGFKESLVNSDNEDYLYFCNRTENYSRWSGATGNTTVTLSGGETTVTVDTTLKSDVFEAGTSSVLTDSGTTDGTTTTTITDHTKLWKNSQWVGFYITITSGGQSGLSRLISANTANGLTFAALPGDPGIGCTYSIATQNPTTSLFDLRNINTPSVNVWAVGQWVNFYIHVTSGAKSGFISLITGNTTNSLTFNAITGLSGAYTYEIRMTKYPLTGTLMINGNQLQYTNIPTDTTITTSAAAATPNNSPVTVVPSTYPANPRGNRLETHYTRMIVGNVRSGLSRDSSGNVQGSQNSGSFYVSKTNDPLNFGFAFPRVAGDGDVVSTPYGGGDITDIVNQEDQFYIFKKRYIESVKYSQDGNDLPQRTQLKTGFGSINKTFKGEDDIYFVTADNTLTSVGRVKLKDTIPQRENIGLPIKRLLDTLDFSATNGKEFKNRLHIACKASSSDAYNNRVLVYNQRTRSFEGLWELSVYGFEVHNGNLYYADSRTPNVYQMLVGQNDAQGTTSYPISSTWKSNRMNLTPKRRFVPKSNFNMQSVSGLGVEGYIRGGTNITFNLYKELSDTAALSFTFGGTETQFLDGQNLFVFLGDRPLGAEPVAAFSNPNLDPNIHFSFIVYFPPIHANYVSLGISNTGLDQYWEVTRLGIRVAQDTIYNLQRIKSLTS